MARHDSDECHRFVRRNLTNVTDLSDLSDSNLTNVKRFVRFVSDESLIGGDLVEIWHLSVSQI